MKKVLLFLSLLITSVSIAQDTPDELKRNLDKWSYCLTHLDVQGVLEYSTPELAELINQFLPDAVGYLSEEEIQTIASISVEAISDGVEISDNGASLPLLVSIEENGELHTAKFLMDMRMIEGTWKVDVPSRGLMPIEIDGKPISESYGYYDEPIDEAAVSATQEAAEAAADAYISDEVEAASALDAETVEDTEEWGTPDENGRRIEPVVTCREITYVDGVRVENIDEVGEIEDSAAASVYYDQEGVEWATAVEEENPESGDAIETIYYVDGYPTKGYPNNVDEDFYNANRDAAAAAVDAVLEEGEEYYEVSDAYSIASAWLTLYHNDNYRVLKYYSTPETLELLDLVKELKSNTSGASKPNRFISYIEPTIDSKLIQFPTKNTAIVPYIMKFGENSDRPTLTGRLHMTRDSEDDTWQVVYTQDDLDAEYSYMRDQK